MAKKSREILAENLKRLRKASSKLNTQLALAEKTGLGEGTINRASNGDSGATVDTIERLAKAFGLQPWQLLVPDLDPAHPPPLPQDQVAQDVLWIAEQIAASPTAKAFFMERFDARKSELKITFKDRRLTPHKYNDHDSTSS